MAVDDSEMQRLWKLTNDLTAQLVYNRSVTLELKQQLLDLQTKTLLQQPSSEVILPLSIKQIQHNVGELADLRLRVENERLREENSQLQEQVREYERWMEYIMTKFRLQNFAMAQSRKESMQEAYKMSEQKGEAALRLQEENVMLHTRLADLGAVARRAIHGEYYATETLIEALETENRTLREMLGVASEDQGFGQTNRLLGHGIGDDGGEVRPPGGNRVSFPSTASDHGSEETDERPLQALGPSIQRATTILPSVALTGFAVTTAQSDAAADAAASFY